MTVAIKLTIEDVKLMVKEFPEDLVMDNFNWYFAKQIDVFADHAFRYIGWNILAYDKSRSR